MRVGLCLPPGGSPSGFEAADMRILRALGHSVERVSRDPEAVVIWFLAEHAAYAVLNARRKNVPTLLILGGQEGAACEPCDYGLWRRPWHVRARARWALWRASTVWSVEATLAARALALAGITPRYRPIDVVPTVFDPEAFQPAGAKDLEAVVSIPKRESPHYRRKGGDVLEKAVVGRSHIRVGAWSSENYRRHLARAKYVLNASHHEGLNNLLAEAMLSGATPIATDIPGNRVLLGDTGHLLQAGEVLDLDAVPLDPVGARERVLRHFPPSLRVEAFRSWLEGVGRR